MPSGGLQGLSKCDCASTPTTAGRRPQGLRTSLHCSWLSVFDFCKEDNGLLVYIYIYMYTREPRNRRGSGQMVLRAASSFQLVEWGGFSLAFFLRRTQDLDEVVRQWANAEQQFAQAWLGG